MQLKSGHFFIFALALSAVLSAVSTSAENWPQWRGPRSQGISTEQKVPADWGPDRNIAWKVAVPPGHSSPVVWGNRIFLTAAIEGDPIPNQKAAEHTLGGKPFVHPDSVAADRRHTLKVLALDTKSGRMVWEHTAYDGPVYDARHRESSFAGPTAATDGAMVFAYFGAEGLFAYTVDGKLVWKAVEPIRTLGLGTGTSPVVYENLVIIQRDEDEGEKSEIVAYDKRTGKVAWRTKRQVQISWATPILVDVSGHTELITNATDASSRMTLPPGRSCGDRRVSIAMPFTRPWLAMVSSSSRPGTP